MLVALVGAVALSAIGVALPPNLLSPLGMAQISAVLAGKRMSKSAPHTSSKSCRYGAESSRNAMQAVSAKPISSGSTGGPCACSASGACSFIPVARPSQKFPPKNSCCVLSKLSTGNVCEYVYRCGVRLAARSRNDPTYAAVVKFSDGIGPPKAAYGMWQEAQAVFWNTDMLSSKLSRPPSRTLKNSVLAKRNVGSSKVTLA